MDIHVHRVTNRWGYVRQPTPERTIAALARALPRRYWIEINGASLITSTPEAHDRIHRQESQGSL
ncbi:MAG TPA: hypothetical protein VFJ50_06600, partial [Gemmatimonadales bacterium]|nr:hypothetical protein [Gemmatimonadales bacterium]